MKKFPRKKVAGALNELVADILTGKVKVEMMEVRVDTEDVPNRWGEKEIRPTGKQWLTFTLIRRRVGREAK
jgi:hypothetical protein